MAPGAVLLVSGVQMPMSTEAIRVVECLNLHHPYTPVAIELSPGIRASPGDIFRIAASFRVRAILSAIGDDRCAQLRSQLADQASLTNGLGVWLRRLRLPVPDNFWAAALEPSVGLSGRVTSELRRRGLPSLKEWRSMLRAVRTTLDLQRDADTAILQVAIDHHYEEHTSYCHAVRRYFGTTPRSARTALGWEWMVWKWLLKKNVVLKRP